jgi:hypothetical protein
MTGEEQERERGEGGSIGVRLGRGRDYHFCDDGLERLILMLWYIMLQACRVA